jgi:DNA invertase Pin-like site-specific DNA recombinase
MAVIGYARCSTDTQDTTAQIAALKAAGCDKVIAEKVSGIVTERKGLARAISALGAGDVLCVTKLDRLGRSLKDVLNTLQAITDRGAGFKVPDNPALDTSNAYGQLLLNVLGALAQFERYLIISRTSEGRTRAKARGVRFGRKPKLTAFQAQEAKQRRSRAEPPAPGAIKLTGSKIRHLARKAVL